MKRVDKILLEKKVFESRKKAQTAIEKGLVTLLRGTKKIKIEKPSQEIELLEQDTWLIDEDAEFRYVSRAGAKLERALEFWSIDVDQWSVLDVGQSTGGFTDCLLVKGARCVVGLDVGHAQLHERLKNNANVLSLEKINAKFALSEETLGRTVAFVGSREFDGMVFDVSFISVVPIIRAQWSLLKPGGTALILFKPQFEIGRGHHDKKGFVNDEEGLRVLQKTVTTLTSFGMSIQGTCPSALRGEDGNQEYFIYLKK